MTVAAEHVLSNIVTDPCVQTLDPTESSKFFKIVYTPPLEKVTLMSYQIPLEMAVPVIRGFYQMKQIAPDAVKLLVQLKLDVAVNNQFAYCDALLPFPSFGGIARYDAAPTVGTLQIKENHTLYWRIGQKFPTRNLEVAMPATIYFSAPLAAVGFVDLISNLGVSNTLFTLCAWLHRDLWMIPF